MTRSRAIACLLGLPSHSTRRTRPLGATPRVRSTWKSMAKTTLGQAHTSMLLQRGISSPPLTTTVACSSPAHRSVLRMPMQCLDPMYALDCARHAIFLHAAMAHMDMKPSPHTPTDTPARTPARCRHTFPTMPRFSRTCATRGRPCAVRDRDSGRCCTQDMPAAARARRVRLSVRVPTTRTTMARCPSMCRNRGSELVLSTRALARFARSALCPTPNRSRRALVRISPRYGQGRCRQSEIPREGHAQHRAQEHRAQRKLCRPLPPQLPRKSLPKQPGR